MNTLVSPTSKKKPNPRIAYVPGPIDPSGKKTKPWGVRLLRNQQTSEFSIEIAYFGHSGTSANVRVSNADRSEFDKIRRKLLSHNAPLPTDKKIANEFVIRLVKAIPSTATSITTKPGWRDKATGFVMPHKMLGTAKGRYVWDTDFVDEALVAPRGSLEDFTFGVLKPALASPFISFAILISMASPLQSYVKQKASRRLLMESAMFNFVAETTTGKTTLGRIAQSCFGSTDITLRYDASDRGIAEGACLRNDLTTVIDDTEACDLNDRDLAKKMTGWAQLLCEGKSRAVTKKMGRTLNWSGFAISSGPDALGSLMTRAGLQRKGDRVRFIEIAVPKSAEGGICGADLTAIPKPRDLARFFSDLESACGANQNVFWEPWIQHLLENDLSGRISELCDEFVNLVCEREGGIEHRFAKKFGLMYAAGVIGVEAGLLPWPADWPLKVVRFCYDNAKRNRDPMAEPVLEGVAEVVRSLPNKVRFPRHDSSSRTIPKLGEAAVGIRRVSDGKAVWYLCPERLDLLAINAEITKLVFDKMKEMQFLLTSGNVSSSEQLRVVLDDGEECKLRFWRLNRNAMVAWLEKRDWSLAS